MGISKRTARRWFQAYKNNGESGLQEKKPGGRPARLTPDDIDAVRAVIGRSTRDAGIDHAEWTGGALAEWVWRELAISLTDRRARQILAKNI